MNPPFECALILISLCAALSGFSIFFHRNPDRTVITDSNQILSPADGTVIHISEEIPTPFDDKPWVCVSIFISLWDVHVNRAPISGKVENLFYKPGAFKMAYDKKNFAVNESNWMVLSNARLRLIIRQIAGKIGKKIICTSKANDSLKQGELFGRILLGSGTQVYMPKNATVCVKAGQKVRAGQTVLATLS